MVAFIIAVTFAIVVLCVMVGRLSSRQVTLAKQLSEAIRLLEKFATKSIECRDAQQRNGEAIGMLSLQREDLRREIAKLNRWRESLMAGITEASMAGAILEPSDQSESPEPSEP